MLELAFPRDLIMTGVIFGMAAFIWAGWAQERPPAGVAWRIVLGVLSAAGLALAGFGVVPVIRHWETPTAISPGGAAFAAYVVMFWLEVIAIVALAILYARTRRMHLMAPTVLIIVGVHFAPLAFVFGQPVLMLAAVLVTVAGTAALRLPRRDAAPSFWCGILTAPIFLVLGVIALLGGLSALAE